MSVYRTIGPLVNLSTDGELDIMMEHTKYMVLLARVYHRSERMEDAMLSLTKAREMQAR